MFDSFMTAEALTTFAGITGAIIVIVQFTKSIVKKRFADHYVRLYSFVIAFLLTFIFTMKNGISLEKIILTLINAMIITIASMGGYEVIADPMAQSIRRNKK